MSWPNDPKRRNEYPFASFESEKIGSNVPGFSQNQLDAPGFLSNQQSGQASSDSQLLQALLNEMNGINRKLESMLGKQVPVSLPDHIYIPEGAQSVDIKNVFDVTAGTSQEILRFECPQGAATRFLYYGVFNDGALASDFDFIPTVDGRRVYPYHGDPLDNFRIYLGIAPDVSNASLVQATLTLQPGQVISWLAVNNAAVDTTMGVRMVGYVDRSQVRKQIQFG